MGACRTVGKASQRQRIGPAASWAGSSVFLFIPPRFLHSRWSSFKSASSSLLGIVAGLIVLLVGLPCTGQLAGNWSTELEYAVQSASFSSLVSVFTVEYTVGALSTSVTTELDMLGLEALTVDSAVTLGDWSLTSSLGFSPRAVGFDYWESSIGITILGTYLEGLFHLDETNAGTYFLATISGTVGSEAFSCVTELTTKQLLFASTTLTVTGLSFGCLGPAAVEVEILCSGFEYALLTLSDLPLLNSPWLTTSASLKFTATEKEISFTWAATGFSVSPCMKVFVDVISGGSIGEVISGLEIDALEFSATLGNASVHDLAVFDPNKRISFLGISHADCWELLEISYSNSSCCGETLSCYAKLYFSSSSPTLFGQKEAVVGFTLPITNQLGIGFELDVDVTGFSFLKFSVEGSW